MKNYLSLVKFSHTIFAMPFAMIGFFLAVQSTSARLELKLLLLVVLCMIFARSAAMAFNRWTDAWIDKLNPRTAIREIPAGILSSNKVIWFVIFNSLAFVAATWFINPLCFYLSPVALLIVLGYSYTKRFTFLCHFILGLGLALAPVGAYLAVTGEFNLIPILYGLAVLFWVSGFDIIYALQDEEFDKEHGLNSVPVFLGKKNALNLSSLLHLMSAASLGFAGWIGGSGIYYWIGMGLFTALLIYQHSLVKPNDLKKVNLAFFTTNGIASVIFALFVLADLYL